MMPTPQPSWADGVIAKDQADQDTLYAKAVQEYNGNATANWIAVNTINRQDGFPLTPLPPKPVKYRIFWNGDTAMIDQAIVPDASLKDPVLPPPANPAPPSGATQPGGGFGPGLTPQGNTTDITELLRLVRAIAAVMGVK